MKITPNVPTNAFTLKAQATWNVLFDDNNKAVAIFSTKSRLADVAIMAPEMYELISDLSQAYDDNQSSHELASRLYDLRCVALRLMDKIEGGGDNG